MVRVGSIVIMVVRLEWVHSGANVGSRAHSRTRRFPRAHLEVDGFILIHMCSLERA